MTDPLDNSHATQWLRARDTATRLRDRPGSENVTARELYLELLTYLDKHCPAVFMTLTGRNLYALLRKGSQPVSGEVLRQYRTTKAEQLVTKTRMPVPLLTQQRLQDLMESLWDECYEVARREAADIAEARSAHLTEQVEALTAEKHQLSERLATSEEFKERYEELTVRYTTDTASRDAEIARQAEEVGRLHETLHSQSNHLHSLEQSIQAQTTALTDSLRKAEAAYEGLQKRSLQDIEAARQQTKRLEKDLATSHTRLAELQQALDNKQRALDDALAQVRHQEQELTKRQLPKRPLRRQPTFRHER